MPAERAPSRLLAADESRYPPDAMADASLWAPFLGGFAGAVVGGAVAYINSERILRQRKLEFEAQTRAALRETYARLLIAQRESREASRDLAKRVDDTNREALSDRARTAHDAFLDAYHTLNLDSSKEMWLEARGLRDVLDDMFALAKSGDEEQCELLVDTARDARQNLERAFRQRLGLDPHQKRNPLGKYDKVERAGD
jgi:hypothetical protein